MNREFTISPIRTYSSPDNVRRAIAKTGDEDIRHALFTNEAGRWYVVFFPTEDQLSERGIHFRWNVVA